MRKIDRYSYSDAITARNSGEDVVSTSKFEPEIVLVQPRHDTATQATTNSKKLEASLVISNEEFYALYLSHLCYVPLLPLCCAGMLKSCSIDDFQ